MTNWKLLSFFVLLATALCAVETNVAHADTTVAQNSEEELKVGVVILSAVNLSKDQADEISARLGTALERKHLISAQAGTMLRAALGTPVPETCIKKRRCVIELGRKLKVDRILFLSLVKVGRRVQLTVTPAETATGYANARLRLRVGDEKEQNRVFAESVIRLLPKAKPRPVKIEPPNGKGDGDGNGNGNGTGTGNDNGGPPIVNPGKSRRLTTPVLVVGGIGVAALLSGAGFGLWATSLYLNRDEYCPGVGTECLDMRDRTENRMNIADASFAIAVVAGATATLLYLYSSEKAPSAVTPVVTPDGVGVSWQGRF